MPEVSRPPGGATLSELVRRHRAERPERIAIVDEVRSVSWRSLDAEVSAAASALRAAGLDDGDRVAIQLGSGIQFVTAYLGAWRAGLISVPVNPAYRLPELAHILTDSGAALLLTASPDALAAVDELRADVPGLRDVLTSLPSAPADDPHSDREGEQLAALVYTSGTSGRPRGAMLSARALVANVDQIAALDPPLVGSDDVGFVPLPLFHVFGLNGAFGVLLRQGATTVLADRFDAAASLASMANNQVTLVVGAPGMFVQWLRQPGLVEGFGTVRLAMSGSAPLPAALVAEYARAGVVLHEGYGLTEAAPIVTSNAVGGGSPKPGAIGRPLPGVDVQLRDTDGDEVEQDDPGQLVIRGRNLFSGYWPDGADGPDEDGWWATGDIAVADEDGVLRIVGRTGDLVLVNGFNVYPAEVEAAFGALPGVRDVAVRAEPDRDTGEAVVAYVVGQKLSVPELLSGAARSLAHFKLPKRVHLVDELPYTATGKVMKWRLRPPAAETAETADAGS